VLVIDRHRKIKIIEEYQRGCSFETIHLVIEMNNFDVIKGKMILSASFFLFFFFFSFFFFF